MNPNSLRIIVSVSKVGKRWWNSNFSHSILWNNALITFLIGNLSIIDHSEYWWCWFINFFNRKSRLSECNMKSFFLIVIWICPLFIRISYFLVEHFSETDRFLHIFLFVDIFTIQVLIFLLWNTLFWKCNYNSKNSECECDTNMCPNIFYRYCYWDSERIFSAWILLPFLSLICINLLLSY